MLPDTLESACELIRLFGDEAEQVALARVDAFIAANDVEAVRDWLLVRAQVRHILAGGSRARH